MACPKCGSTNTQVLGSSPTHDYGHQKDYKTYPEGKLPAESTIQLEASMEIYQGSDYILEMSAYEAFGYSPISKEILPRFSQALMNAILTGTQYEQEARESFYSNMVGYWAFEFHVEPITLKQILPNELM